MSLCVDKGTEEFSAKALNVMQSACVRSGWLHLETRKQEVPGGGSLPKANEEGSSTSFGRGWKAVYGSSPVIESSKYQH